MPDVDLMNTGRGRDEVVQIATTSTCVLDARLRIVPDARGSVLICRGLTGDLSRTGSVDELAEVLATQRWSSLRFDYRGRGRSTSYPGTPSVQTMGEDVQVAFFWLRNRSGGEPAAIIARGFGARLVLEALKGEGRAPFVFWAPILWLQTSLELRGRFHELRRVGRLVVDGTELSPEFVNSIADPSDAQVREWIVAGRRHVIVQPEGDAVAPLQLGKELHELIAGSGGHADFVLVPGAHPHPKASVLPQIDAVVNSLQSICPPSSKE